MPNDGPVSVDDVRVVLPEKPEVYNTIEGTIAHFKLVMEGIKVPAGEVYSFSEAGNGELGFFIVSDGSGTPYRVRCRPPCWFNLNAAHDMLRGGMIADIIPTFGSRQHDRRRVRSLSGQRDARRADEGLRCPRSSWTAKRFPSSRATRSSAPRGGRASRSRTTAGTRA